MSVPREAARFLHALDPDTTSWTFQTFDDDPERGDATLARIWHGTIEQHAVDIKQLNDHQRTGAFVTVQRD